MSDLTAGSQAALWVIKVRVVRERNMQMIYLSLLQPCYEVRNATLLRLVSAQQCVCVQIKETVMAKYKTLLALLAQSLLFFLIHSL